MKEVMKKIVSKLNDENFIKLQYLKNRKSILKVNNPRTFSEKINYIKLGDWLEDKSDYVDKYKVRSYVKRKIGEKYLIKLIGIFDSEEKIIFKDLPNQFVIKLNNGSGCNLVVKNKYLLDEVKTKVKLNEWMRSDFYKKTREKQYKNVEQKLICEEYLENISGELVDYKFFCFNGKMEFVQVDTGRSFNHIQNFYNNKWEKLDFEYVCKKNTYIDSRPEKFEEMIIIAEKLSEEFPFVRVDLYYVDNKIYFGELTFTPNNGMIDIKPKEKDLEIASLINLERYK